MNDLYRNALPDVSTGFVFDDGVLKAALKRIYSEDFNPMTEIEENLFNEFWDKLNEATEKGFSEVIPIDPDDDFYQALQHNNAVFSTFKVHRMQNDMAARMVDETGNLKTFEQWLKDVQPIADHQCRTWFKTEYDTAVKRAHQAAEWKQFEREADVLPNLEWIKSTSVTPGEDHRIYWGTIRPINDEFWEHHKPGDRWGCKCDLRSTDKEPTPMEIPKGGKTDKPAAGLDTNPGKDGIIFSDTHPYNPPDCDACTLPGKRAFSGSLKNLKSLRNLTTFFLNRRKKDCYHCSRPAELMKKAVATKESKSAAEIISEQTSKFFKRLISERKKIQESHFKQRDLQLKNLKTGNITISKKTIKSILQHTHNENELKAALVIDRHISHLKFVRVSPLGEGKDMNNPVDVANINAKIKRHVTNYNSYEYRHSGNVFYVKTEQLKIRGNIFERLYSFTKKP